MKGVRKLLALVLALALCLGVAGMPSASADSGIKAKFGAFAAQTSDKIFMVLPGTGVSSLYSMPVDGGVLTLIETTSQINDLIADAVGNLYYLRYTGSVFQAVMRTTDGARTIVAEFAAGEIAHTLSLYNGKLYCLVNSHLMEIDLTQRLARQVSDRLMTTYTIADGIIYYESGDDIATKQMASTLAEGASVNGSNGRLYSMMLDGTNDMRLFDQGVSMLAAFDEYIYFHNLNDSYLVKSDTQEWLDGRLYRINVQTNQSILVLDKYDWDYRPTDYGLLVYREKELLLASLSGENPVLIYEPDPYSYMAILDDCVILYEYNLQKLTRIPLDLSEPVVLWTGNFVSDGASGEVIGGSSASTPAPDTASSGVTAGSSATAATTVRPTATPVPGYTAGGSMTIGASGEEVKKLQNRLIELGYLTGKADGIYGNKTAAAVKAFQSVAGLTVDGIAGSATIKAINKSDAPSKPSTGTDPSYLLPNSSTVKLTRDDVLALDRSLWAYARNEIYARHGYVFETKKYADYFASKSWYKAGGFKTSSLNATEWYNMELIADMEKEFSSSATPKPTAKPTSTPKPSGGSSVLPPAAESIGADQYIFPTSNTVKLTKDQIRAVDSSLWPYARNEIYARHGYSFTKTEYKTYFGSKSWYKVGGFNTKDLNDVEWYNMELIAWMEANEK